MRGVGNRRNVCDVSSNLGTWDLPTCDDQTCAVLTIDEMNAMSTVPVPKMWRIRALWCEILDARLAPPLISAQERWPDVSTACAAQTCDALSGIAYMVSTASCATATGMCPPPACMHAGYTPSATALTCYDTNSNTPAACTARTCAALSGMLGMETTAACATASWDVPTACTLRAMLATCPAPPLYNAVEITHTHQPIRRALATPVR